MSHGYISDRPKFDRSAYEVHTDILRDVIKISSKLIYIYQVDVSNGYISDGPKFDRFEYEVHTKAHFPFFSQLQQQHALPFNMLRRSMVPCFLLLSGVTAQLNPVTHTDNLAGGMKKGLPDGEYYFFNLDKFGMHLSWSALQYRNRLALKSPETVSGVTKWLVKNTPGDINGEFTLTNHFKGVRGMGNFGKTIKLNNVIEGTGFTKKQKDGSKFALERTMMPNGYPGVAYYIKSVDGAIFSGDSYLGIENDQLRLTESGLRTKFMAVPASKEYSVEENPVHPINAQV